MALLLAFSLCACAKGSEGSEKEKPTYTYPEFPEEAARYTVEQINHSTVDLETQEFTIKTYYDKVILEGDSEEIKAINAMIEADYERYFYDNGVADFEENFSSHPLYGDKEHPFLFTYSAAVTHNQGNIFSIRMIIDSYFGGVTTLNSYGMTFDTSTGKAVTLPELTGMDAETLRQSFVDVTWNQIQYDALYDDAREVLEGLTIDEYLFYVEEGEVVLTYPCYTFAPGVNGAATIHTGIRILSSAQ